MRSGERGRGSEARRRDALRWAAYGAAFGACFPAIAFGIRAVDAGLSGAREAFGADPLMWIIATAPLFLGGFAWLGGRQHERVRRLSDHLETLVAERTAQLAQTLARVQVVTDSVEEGLVTVDADGRIVHASAAAEALFGPRTTTDAAAYLFGEGDSAATFRLALEQLREDVLPVELLIDQLAAAWTRGGRSFRLRARLCRGQADGAAVLLVVRDVTEELEAEAASARSRELQRVLAAVSTDAGGFARFAEETEAILATLDAAPPSTDARRGLHTLKGNAAIFGLEAVARACHDAETALAEASSGTSSEALPGDAPDGPPDRVTTALAEVARAWNRSREAIEAVLPRRRAEERVVSVHDLRRLGALARAWRDRRALLELCGRMIEVPLAPTLERLAAHARRIADRLGRELEVEVAAADARFDEGRLDAVVATLVHVVRNAVDHGIESPEERVRAGKPRAGRLALRASEDGSTLRIEVVDDGRGIDRTAVVAAAERAGLRDAAGASLLDLLCADGVSTAAETTDLSGRGVGLAAVRAAVTAVSGRLEVTTEVGVGTRFVVEVPRVAPESLVPVAA
jgi:two-component system chemotaxis sensor kinase CheA